MFSNLTKEIIDYSLVPVFILAVIGVICLILSKIKKDTDYKINYIIKFILLLIIGLVLPLIIGYTIWRYNNYVINDTLSANLGYLLLLVFLVVVLAILLIVVGVKLFKSTNHKEDNVEIEENSVEE